MTSKAPALGWNPLAISCCYVSPLKWAPFEFLHSPPTLQGSSNCLFRHSFGSTSFLSSYGVVNRSMGSTGSRWKMKKLRRRLLAILSATYFSKNLGAMTFPNGL